MLFLSGRFKNVQFEIKGTADPGTFEVQAKFMGMDVKKIDLVFQVTSNWGHIVASEIVWYMLPYILAYKSLHL
jgi:hypothetical protein